MPAKLSTFTSPNSANYWWRHLTDVPFGPAVTTTFVCSEPEDGLAPDPSFFSYSGFLSWIWRWTVTLPHKILAVISSVSSEDNIGMLL